MRIRKDDGVQFYNFYRDGVTQSMLDKWMCCPKQCYYEYALGLSPYKQESDAIFFGNLCHHALEQAYSQNQLPLPGVVSSWIKEYEELDHVQAQYDSLSSNELENWEYIVGKAKTTMQSYMLRHTQDFIENWEIAETRIRVPFKFADGAVTYINGKLDGGFQQPNGLTVMDHKCMGRINLNMLMKLLPVDLQCNTYLWCCREMGYKPSQFVYNIIRNTSSKPSKRKQQSLDEWELDLTSKIDRNPEEWFYRIPVPVNDAMMDSFYNQQLYGLMCDVRAWYDSGYAWPPYFRSRNLKTEYGTLASCADVVLSGDVESCFQRKVLFPELGDIHEDLGDLPDD